MAVAALWRACGLVVPHNDPGADFHFALAGPASTVLVAEEDGAVVGTVMAGHDGHRGWLYYVGVDPARRGLGLGRALVSAAEGWLRVRGVRKVQLLVRETNGSVVEFYRRLGFETEQRVVMSRWLGPEDRGK